MADFSTFNRDNLTTLRRELNAALDLMDIEDVAFKIGTLSFSATECSVKITFNNSGHADKEARDLEMIIIAHGLKGTEGTGGEQLVGYNYKAPRYPWLVNKTDGKTYKYTDTKARLTFGEVTP